MPAFAVQLSIIIVTHGARELTLDCLKSLAPETRKVDSEVIVVDNDSPCELAAEIAFAHPDIRVLPQVTNLGFAAAANLGADFACGEYLLFLNPDTIVTENTLAPLVDFARRNPCSGIWGVRTFFANGNINPTCCRRRPTLWRLFCTGLGLDTRFPRSSRFSGMGYASLLPQECELPVDVVCGACLLMERSVWNWLGGFSPAFFMYGEDDDLCMRAKRLGIPSKLVPDLSIIHHGSGSEADQERKLCQILASRCLILRGHFATPARRVGVSFLLLRPFLGQIFAKPELRTLWRNIWRRRNQWLPGRFG